MHLPGDELFTQYCPVILAFPDYLQVRRFKPRTDLVERLYDCRCWRINGGMGRDSQELVYTRPRNGPYRSPFSELPYTRACCSMPL